MKGSLGHILGLELFGLAMWVDLDPRQTALHQRTAWESSPPTLPRTAQGTFLLPIWQ